MGDDCAHVGGYGEIVAEERDGAVGSIYLPAVLIDGVTTMRFLRSTIGSLMTAALLPAALIAQTDRSHRNVDGVWRMDTTKFAKRDRELAGLVLRVSHLGDTLLIVTDVQDTGRPAAKMTMRYLPMGEGAAPDTVRHINLESWEGDTLVLHSTEQRPDRTLLIEERWTFDASGSTLSRFQHVTDTKLGRVSQQTLVFTRQ
jgi:hypothetical protein